MVSSNRFLLFHFVSHDNTYIGLHGYRLHGIAQMRGKKYKINWWILHITQNKSDVNYNISKVRLLIILKPWKTKVQLALPKYTVSLEELLTLIIDAENDLRHLVDTCDPPQHVSGGLIQHFRSIMSILVAIFFFTSLATSFRYLIELNSRNFKVV